MPSDEQPLTNSVLHPNSIKIEPAEVKPALSKAEIERGKQDIETVNSDLKLLSTLLGRPISPNDLPQLTQQFGSGTSSEGPKKRYPSSTSTTSTTTQKPAIVKEVELLQSLLRSPNKDIKSQVGSDEYYGNTDEAILATILKQKGIGPSHNNVPIEVIEVVVVTFNRSRFSFKMQLFATCSAQTNNNRLLNTTANIIFEVAKIKVEYYLLISNYLVKTITIIKQLEQQLPHAGQDLLQDNHVQF